MSIESAIVAASGRQPAPGSRSQRLAERAPAWGMLPLMRTVRGLFRRDLRVLAYHRVREVGPDFAFDRALVSASPEGFRNQMRHLAARFNPVSCREVAAALGVGDADDAAAAGAGTANGGLQVELGLTLDEVERALNPDVLVIADRERPIAIAGVMGGAESEVTDATTDLLLECALFEPLRAEGHKCARSWRILPEVGTDPRYPDLSLRDADAVAAWDAAHS